MGMFACRWSFLTSALVHHDVEQLGRNMFIVFFFSQMLYRDLGAVGVWFTYLLAGLGKWQYLDLYSASVPLCGVPGLCTSTCTATFTPNNLFARPPAQWILLKLWLCRIH